MSLSKENSKENKVIIDGMTYYGGLNQPNLKFVKVNVDCWEKIFDLLSLRDILAMSSTCLRMRQIGGHYFRENFHGTRCHIFLRDDRNPCFRVTDSKHHRGKVDVEVELKDFLRFADTVWLDWPWILDCEDGEDFEDFERLQNYTSRNLLESLTTFCLFDQYLSENYFHGLTSIANNIETIDITMGVVEDRSFGQFLASCPKLECLRINRVRFESNGVRNSVFNRVYPMLTDFQCIDIESVPPLTSFLERNPSIKSLRVSVNDLWKIHFDWTTIRLNCLDIDIDELKIGPVELAKRIKALHANGYFKTLRINNFGNNFALDWEMFVNKMTSFSSLKVLYIEEFNESISHLVHLKELHIKILDDDINLETIAKNLRILERLWIMCTVHQFLPFLRHSKILKVAIFEDRSRQGNALNLCNLNQVRRMGGMKRKLKIGVHEDIYLATKWMTMNVDYDLIEIARTETVREQFVYKDLHEFELF